MHARHFVRLLQHEFALEWKNRQTLTSLVVYSLSTIFITYLSYRHRLDLSTWNALFWIITLFAATNAVARSFLQESRGLQFFYYTLLHPATVILAKTCYNILLLFILSLLNFAVFLLFFELPHFHILQFITGLFLGCFGLSTVLTLVSGIVAKAQGGAALVAILAFPLLFPLLSSVLEFSGNALQGHDWSANESSLLLLIALNSILVALSYLLFPYLWRE
jgi:heme exporter protein B